MKTTKQDKIDSRKKRVRIKISGTGSVPRLAVRVSNAHIYAQIIDDERNLTLANASDLKEKKIGTPTETAKIIGKKIAEEAKAKKIKRVVFDRGSSLYHGKVKALAEAARENGLDF